MDYGMQHIRALAERGRALMMRAERQKEHTEGMTRRGIGLMATAVGGLASGVYSGRFPTTTFIGLPLDLLAGLVVGGVGVVGLAGRESEYVSDFGGGLVAGFLARFGAGVGTRWKNKQPLFSSAAPTSGALPPAYVYGAGAMPMPNPAQAAVNDFARTVINMPTD